MYISIHSFVDACRFVAIVHKPTITCIYFIAPVVCVKNIDTYLARTLQMTLIHLVC